MSSRLKPGPYREITLPAVLFGIVVGVLLSACFTYAGLLLGFTIGGSAIAAILGFGFLRGILGQGTIVENNINQTIASGINGVTTGLIFTVPAFYLLGVKFNPVIVGFGAVAGALLGILFIIPIRKQMIELERLRFPTGTAVATVLKSPGAGIVKARLLLIGLCISAGFTVLTQFAGVPEEVDVGAALGLPSYIENVWALSLFSLAAGYITGRAGLVVLAGGVLAYWMVTPVAVHQGWLPAEMLTGYISATGADRHAAGLEISGWAHSHLNRPIGIGMLVGGAVTGIVIALPSMMAAFASLRRIDLSGRGVEELPIRFLYLGIGLSFAVLLFSTLFTMETPSVPIALLVAVAGTAWLALAGVVVAQATGMTDWSPISGLALLAIVLGLVATHHSVPAAILIGAAVCVAISECADMMQDLKTGHLVGATPIRQQLVELAFVAFGPIVCLTVIAILWKNPGFGEGKPLAAPQAQAVKATIEAVSQGQVPWPKYLGGAVIGGLLGLTGVAGLGVLVGLSMYLPLAYILPYGLGCVVQMGCSRLTGPKWVEERGVPLAAGLLVGEPLIILLKSIIVILGGGS